MRGEVLVKLNDASDNAWEANINANSHAIAELESYIPQQDINKTNSTRMGLFDRDVSPIIKDENESSNNNCPLVK